MKFVWWGAEGTLYNPQDSVGSASTCHVEHPFNGLKSISHFWFFKGLLSAGFLGQKITVPQLNFTKSPVQSDNVIPLGGGI